MKLGFIGTGNMAGAILAGICQTKAVLPQDIYAFDIDGEKTKKLKQSFGIQIADSAEDLIAACDAVLLGLKPVSYTHLDVYKRQPIYSGTGSFGPCSLLKKSQQQGGLRCNCV